LSKVGTADLLSFGAMGEGIWIVFGVVRITVIITAARPTAAKTKASAVVLKRRGTGRGASATGSAVLVLPLTGVSI
jgi:hypothetical protein